MLKLLHRKSLFAALLALTAFGASAQMGLDIDLNRTVYMQYEPVYACISLRNDSGRALVFGNDPRLQGFILFEIRDANGRLVPKRPGAEISVTGLVLGPGEVKRIPLTGRKLERYGGIRITLSAPGLKTHDTFFSVIGKYEAKPFDIHRDFVVAFNGGLAYQILPQTEHPAYLVYNAPFEKRFELLASICVKAGIVFLVSFFNANARSAVLETAEHPGYVAKYFWLCQHFNRLI